MMKRSSQFLAWSSSAILVWGITLSVQAFNNESLLSITLPSDPISFQSGQGSQLATTYCLICHSAEYVYMQPPHSREKWEEIIHKMKNTFGCPIPESEFSTLARYLVSQNEIQPAPIEPALPHHISTEHAGTLNKHPGEAQQGKRVFSRYCVNCHGESGKGDGPIGKSLVPPAADLTLLGKKSDQEILKTIRKGRPGTAMPSWKNDLSSQEMLDVLSHIRTLTP